MVNSFHTKNKITQDEWLTPPHIIEALGEFDLDPCAPVDRPWPTAKKHLTYLDNGHLQEWNGRVWCNPPYSWKEAWLNRLVMHGNGIAMIFARTETQDFFNYVWPCADGLLFIRGRVTFYDVSGTEGKYNGGAPSVLIAYGEQNNEALANCDLKGKFINLNKEIYLIGYIRNADSDTWKLVVKYAMVNLNNEASLAKLYREVEKIAPEKVKTNKHYKEKIRQTLQMHFKNIKRGT